MGMGIAETVVVLAIVAFTAFTTVVVPIVATAVLFAAIAIPIVVVAGRIGKSNGGFAIVGPTIALAPPVAPPLKKVVCPSCGGSKLLPPKTAYVYCDYCGALVDWDFRIACRTAGSARPGPAYEAILRVEGPVQEAARTAGDQAAYAASVRRVFDTHFTAAPASWSPRLGDPEYRAALLDVTVRQYTAAAFDPTCRALERAMTDSVKALVWTPGFPAPKVGAPSFAQLTAAVLAHTGRFVELGIPDLPAHPDQPSAELQRAIARSAFAQGWMAYLDKPAQDVMIAELGLDGEYLEVPTVDTTERHCAGCARILRVVAGARRVVCEDCGHPSDVDRPEIQCAGCGGPVSIAWSKRSFRCPSCAMELRVD